MRLFIASLIMVGATPAFAADDHNCPSGQSPEVITLLIHPAVTEYETVTISVPVIEGSEIVTIPAQFEWIKKTESYVHPKTLTYTDQVPVKATYKKVEIPLNENLQYHDILLKLDGSYVTVADKSVDRQNSIYDYTAVDVPMHYLPKEKTIPMPAPLEENGKLKVLKSPPITLPKIIPYVTKKQTLRRIKSRKPAILQEVLGDCR